MRNLSQFRKDQAGVAAVEAGLILPVFILMLVYSMEFLAFAFNSQQLDHALVKTMQEIRLGTASAKAQAQKMTAEEYYKYSVCEEMFISNCKSKISVSIDQYDDDAQIENSFNDQFVASSKLIFVKVEIDYSPTALLGRTDTRDLKIKAGMVAQTEPF